MGDWKSRGGLSVTWLGWCDLHGREPIRCNAQGFLMQLLGPDQSIYAITDPAGAPNSLELT
jgi:hypothetical protein